MWTLPPHPFITPLQRVFTTLLGKNQPINKMTDEHHEERALIKVNREGLAEVVIKCSSKAIHK